MSRLQNKKLFLFDIDGTLALGNHLLEGASDLIAFLQEKGHKIFYTTNNSTRSRQDYVSYFAQWNISVQEEEFLTAGYMSILYCTQHLKDKKIYFVGTESFEQELRKAGLCITTVYEEDVECVLVAFDTSLTFQKLEDACRILQNTSVQFLATNPDLCCPVPGGAVPDCGSICMMLENATGRKPYYIGKPSPDIVEECRRESGCSRQETLLVGDRIYTDMLCAQNAGVDGLLVLSGEAAREDVQVSMVEIPYIMENVGHLLTYLQTETG